MLIEHRGANRTATATGPCERDFRFRDQIRDSAAGAPRNIAEGFERFRDKDFIRYLEYARASLGETKNHLLDGRQREYFAEPAFRRLTNLAAAAHQVTTRLLLAKQRQVAEAAKKRKRKKGRRNG